MKFRQLAHARVSTKVTGRQIVFGFRNKEIILSLVVTNHVECLNRNLVLRGVCVSAQKDAQTRKIGGSELSVQ